MAIQDGEDERGIENKVVADIRNFILRMGKGFSFIGNQYRVELNGEEFFIDLLFFNRNLQCLVAFDLLCCAQHNNDPIGIILCSGKNEAFGKICYNGVATASICFKVFNQFAK